MNKDGSFLNSVKVTCAMNEIVVNNAKIKRFF